MSTDLDQLVADVGEIKAMLRQLLAGGEAAPPSSPIMETLRAAEALGLDPIQAMAPFRVNGSRGRPAKKTTRGGKHV